MHPIGYSKTNMVEQPKNFEANDIVKSHQTPKKNINQANFGTFAQQEWGLLHGNTQSDLFSQILYNFCWCSTKPIQPNWGYTLNSTAYHVFMFFFRDNATAFFWPGQLKNLQISAKKLTLHRLESLHAIVEHLGIQRLGGYKSCTSFEERHEFTLKMYPPVI